MKTGGTPDKGQMHGTISGKKKFFNQRGPEGKVGCFDVVKKKGKAAIRKRKAMVHGRHQWVKKN